MADVGRYYVFVCCGDAEHVHTLHYALEMLLDRTKCGIYVVTDSKRNEIHIQHDNVLDISTPEHFNHHQASIWLKTSLHNILPKGNRYAYLDTDVLAMGEHVDDIFEQYIPPIRFAADHCRMMQFSPYAVNCNCLVDNEAYREKVNRLMANEDPLSNTTDSIILQHRARLQKLFQLLKKNKIKTVLSAIRYVLSSNKFQFTPEFYFDKKKKIWYTHDGVEVMYQVNIKKIAKTAGLRYNSIKNDVIKSNGDSIWRDSCSHLKIYAENKFQIKIEDNNWQHWNGGVFLFSDESKQFMDTWHAITMDIFEDSNWKTRDQGTLITTVWLAGLQNHPVLDDTWNYIADFHNATLDINYQNNTISKDEVTYKKPEFIHVYHHFGDEQWDVWNWIKNIKAHSQK